ncbi:MAG: hypothetical protein KC468_39255, partial [Myxococcales bacterium]|nr:hypothetical protein [Myxococcales bacterium]
METLPLRCTCGAVTGRALAWSRARRNVCHCRGCQAYARWLRRAELLDDAGGTDIYQLTPSQLRIDAGIERLRCVQLTEAGALRWYTDCCRTPVANALAQAWVPWLGMPHLFVDAARAGGTRGRAPLGWKIHARHARAPVPGGHATGPASLVLHTLVSALRDAALGRARPNPLRIDGRPRVAPERLDDEARARLGLLPPPALARRRAAPGCG